MESDTKVETKIDINPKSEIKPDPEFDAAKLDVDAVTVDPLLCAGFTMSPMPTRLADFAEFALDGQDLLYADLHSDAILQQDDLLQLAMDSFLEEFDGSSMNSLLLEHDTQSETEMRPAPQSDDRDYQSDPGPSNC